MVSDVDPDLQERRPAMGAVGILLASTLAAIAVGVLTVHRPGAASASPTASARAVAVPVAAPSASAPDPAVRALLEELAREARQLVANVQIARIALGADLDRVARDHVADALPAAERLVAEAGRFAAAHPSLAARFVPNGRAPATGTWLPLEDDEHVVRSLDESLRHRHQSPVPAAEAHAVHVHRAVDVGLVLAKLRAAQPLVERGDYGLAIATLDAAEAAVVAETDIRDLPLERAHDDLVVARRLAEERDFGSAADALGHARAALADAELADASLKARPEAVQLGEEIGELQSQVGARVPAGLERLHDAVGRWLAVLGRWLPPPRATPEPALRTAASSRP